MFATLLSLVRAVGFRRVRALGYLLGELEFRLTFLSRRRYVRELATILGRTANDPAVHEQMRHAYRINTAAVLEILAMVDRQQDESVLLPLIRVDGIEHVQAALAGGRGAILLGGHMGNGLLMGLRLVASGVPVSVIHAKALMMEDGFIDRTIHAYGIETIEANEGIQAYSQLIGALRRGRVVYISADQGTKRGLGQTVRFLGKDMPMPVGPAQLARHSGAPVLPLAMIAAEPVWHFEIQPALAREKGASLALDVERLLRVTEQQVLRTPQLWSWHHRRWRKYSLAKDVPATVADAPNPAPVPTPPPEFGNLP